MKPQTFHRLNFCSSSFNDYIFLWKQNYIIVSARILSVVFEGWRIAEAGAAVSPSFQKVAAPKFSCKIDFFLAENLQVDLK